MSDAMQALLIRCARAEGNLEASEQARQAADARVAELERMRDENHEDRIDNGISQNQLDEAWRAFDDELEKAKRAEHQRDVAIAAKEQTEALLGKAAEDLDETAEHLAQAEARVAELKQELAVESVAAYRAIDARNQAEAKLAEAEKRMDAVHRAMTEPSWPQKEAALKAAYQLLGPRE